MKLIGQIGCIAAMLCQEGTTRKLRYGNNTSAALAGQQTGQGSPQDAIFMAESTRQMGFKANNVGKSSKWNAVEGMHEVEFAEGQRIENCRALEARRQVVQRDEISIIDAVARRARTIETPRISCRRKN